MACVRRGAALLAFGATLTLAEAWPQEPAAQAPSLPSPQEQLAALLKNYQIVTEDGRQVVELTLSQALALALERSITLQATQLGESIAGSQIRAAQERNNPELSQSADYGRSVSAFPSFGRGSRTDALTYSATLSKKLANGMELSAIFTEQNQDVTGFDITTDGEASNFGASTSFETSSLTGQVTIPFFQDSGAVNDVPIRLAEVGLRTSRNTTRQTRLDLLRLVATTYWDLAGIRERIRVEAEAVKLSEQLLRDNRARLEAGVLSPADVKVSESQLAQDRKNLLTSRVAMQRIEDLVRAALNLEALEYGLKPVESPALREGEFELEPLLRKTLSNDPALANLEAELERNRHDTEQSLNKARTNLDLALKYTLNGFGKNTSGAAGNLTNTDLQGYGATLTWTVPLFDTETAEEIAQRRLERAQIELRLANRRSELTVQAQTVRRQLRLAEEEVRTARVAVSLQNELLQNEIERFRLGESTSFQVAQVQQDFLRAQQNEILTRISYEKIFLELLLLTGDIHSQYALPPEPP
jgi:outer membrane protein TolC